MDYSLIEKAGMTQAEFAELVGVTRTTVNHWVRGKMNPNRYLKAHVSSIMEGIAAAVTAGELPLSGKVPKHERGTKLSEVVAGHTAAA